MNKKIFFSWQSDILLNKKVINSALKKAIKELKKEPYCEYFHSIDEATKNKSGSINIEESIYSKIRNCNIFIADTSIVNHSIENKKNKIRIGPNPNVLIELGYAAGTIGWERIITIIDTSEEELFDYLPFDIRSHRTIKYDFSENDTSKLILDLKLAIQQIEKFESELFDITKYVNSKVDKIYFEIFNHLGTWN